MSSTSITIARAPNEHRSVFREHDMEAPVILAYVFRQDAEHNLVDFGNSFLQIFVVEWLEFRKTQKAHAVMLPGWGNPTTMQLG